MLAGLICAPLFLYGFLYCTDELGTAQPNPSILALTGTRAAHRLRRTELPGLLVVLLRAIERVDLHAQRGQL